jgi:hypothetical protein
MSGNKFVPSLSRLIVFINFGVIGIFYWAFKAYFSIYVFDFGQIVSYLFLPFCLYMFTYYRIHFSGGEWYRFCYTAEV